MARYNFVILKIGSSSNLQYRTERIKIPLTPRYPRSVMGSDRGNFICSIFTISNSKPCQLLSEVAQKSKYNNFMNVTKSVFWYSVIKKKNLTKSKNLTKTSLLVDSRPWHTRKKWNKKVTIELCFMVALFLCNDVLNVLTVKLPTVFLKLFQCVIFHTILLLIVC